MPAERRPGAEITAWSTVHGMAMLVLEGPLARLSSEQRDAAIAHAVATVVRGLTAAE